jgi:tetratricopeptide (TPR) repeat protein
VDLDTLRRIDVLARLPRHRLVEASRRLLWRRYAPGELILPSQVHIRLNGLVHRGEVQVVAVRQGRRHGVGRISAGEPIEDELWISCAAPVELRATEPTTLCLLPPDGQRAGILPAATLPASVVGRAAPGTDRVTRAILLLSVVLLLVLVAWHWQSPWRNLLSQMAYGLGSHRLAGGEYVSALSLLQTSADLNPRLASAHNDIGYILYWQGQAKEAQAAFQRAVAADPSSAVAQNNLGLAYMESGQLDLAREALEEAVALNPESAAAWTNLGVVEHATGQPERAIRAYRAALRVDPDSAVALANLGVLHYEQRLFPEAQSYLERALEAQPRLAYAQVVLGAIALDEGDHAHAWHRLQAVAPDLAEDPLMHFYMALWYEEAGMWEVAERELDRVLELEPHPALAALSRSHLVALASFDRSIPAEGMDTRGSTKGGQ